MLQFVINGGERFSPEEEAQMAIEGGCRWIQLSASVADDNERTLKTIAESVIPLCRESDAFLVIEDDVDLVDDLKVHGVFLRDNTRSTVMEARERLGAHAVIGVYAEALDEVLALRGLDVDYVSVPVPSACAGESVPGFYASLLKGMRDGGIDFHLVASGEFASGVLPSLLDSGCAGVVLSTSISNADNISMAVSQIIRVLDEARLGDAAGKLNSL